ncbi:hypothetical protein Gotri_006179, partial [Gossypium trilobum]|nr:hypothetical protein [Gossypium trilobum]
KKNKKKRANEFWRFKIDTVTQGLTRRRPLLRLNLMENNRGSMSSIVDKHGVLSKRKLRSESAADDLSDINDAEITGYLNNKKEMLFKSLIWEAMNKDYQKNSKKERTEVVEKKETDYLSEYLVLESGDLSLKIINEACKQCAEATASNSVQLIQIHPYLIWQKKQRKPATRKKSSARKAVDSRMEKVTEEEVVEKKKGLSSKINYDALEKLTNEPEERDSEKAKKEGIDSNRDRQIEREHSKGISTLEDGGFEEDNFSDESEHENAYLCSYEEDEEYGYGEDYREDYDYEEF